MRVMLIHREDMECIHLTDGSRDLRPYTVNVVVQALEREDLQRGIGFAEETDEPSGGRQGDHAGDLTWVCSLQMRRSALAAAMRLGCC